MKSNKKFKTLFIAIIAIMLITSCKKNEADKDLQIAKDNSYAEKVFNDVIDISDEADKTGILTSYKSLQEELQFLSVCAVVVRDTITLPHILTIDFGASNCLCNDGYNRRGKIIVQYEGRYRDSGHVHTINFDNYFVNDNQVTGTKTVVNNGRNINGNLSFTITINGAIIFANNSGTFEIQANKTREWVFGENTATRLDDEFLITGTASGERIGGRAFTSIVISPLRRVINCQYHHYVSGVLEITPQGRAVRTLDFGNGDCDNIGTVTINGVSSTIDL